MRPAEPEPIAIPQWPEGPSLSYESREKAQTALALAFLAEQESDTVVQARQVAAHLGIPTDSALKILQTLARQELILTTPYFVPDEPLITAMCVAAASGTDVRFMMTGIPDKKVPFYAAHAYFQKLLDAGVTVYKYDAGFLHAKTVTVE